MQYLHYEYMMENETSLSTNQTWIIADTNYFLHFQYPDQIDWNSLVSSKKITLVIPMIVIDELDKHKNAPSAPNCVPEQSQ